MFVRNITTKFQETSRSNGDADGRHRIIVCPHEIFDGEMLYYD
jgi:hypothetical protein